MAVDSRDKRASAQGFLYAPLPLADGTVDEADRPHVAWVYSGLDYSVSAAVNATSTPSVAGAATSTPSVAGAATSTPSVAGAATSTPTTSDG